MLPVPAELRPVVAEDRADIVDLDGQSGGAQVVLEERAHHRRGSFGAQRQAPLAPVQKRVHLLVNDVRPGAHPAQKYLRVLDDRRTDLLIAVPVRQAPDLRLDAMPAAYLRGQDVLHPPGRLDAHAV